MTNIVVKQSPINDLGAFAGKSFKKDECVGEYTGDIIGDDDVERRYDGSDKTYLFLRDDGMCIDATHTECPLKYLNHSCEPNCESREEKGRIYYYAVRDIAQGEELTVDYNLQVDPADDDAYTCLCGARTCRKTMKEV